MASLRSDSGGAIRYARPEPSRDHGLNLASRDVLMVHFTGRLMMSKTGAPRIALIGYGVIADEVVRSLEVRGEISALAGPPSPVQCQEQTLRSN